MCSSNRCKRTAVSCSCCKVLQRVLLAGGEKRKGRNVRISITLHKPDIAHFSIQRMVFYTAGFARVAYRLGVPRPGSPPLATVLATGFIMTHDDA